MVWFGCRKLSIGHILTIIRNLMNYDGIYQQKKEVLEGGQGYRVSQMSKLRIG
jgi:hypothetical protein